MEEEARSGRGGAAVELAEGAHSIPASSLALCTAGR